MKYEERPQNHLLWPFHFRNKEANPERSSDLPKTRSKKWAGPKVTQHSTLIKKKKNVS